nr:MULTISPECIES: PASTA domain-containing protein [unclassified Ornithinimicrobium]
MIEVPSVIGKQWGEAEQILTDAGFEASRKDVLGGYFGTVRTQSVDAGEMVERGTEVVLEIV